MEKVNLSFNFGCNQRRQKNPTSTSARRDSYVKNAYVEKAGDVQYMSVRPGYHYNTSDPDALYHPQAIGQYKLFGGSGAFATCVLINNTLWYNTGGYFYYTSATQVTGLSISTSYYGSMSALPNNQIYIAVHDKGYIFDGTTMTQIVDATYVSLHLANLYRNTWGGIWLDNYLFVAKNTGEIYNSNLSTPGTWTATDFITAEKAVGASGTLVAIEEHREGIVAFGTEAIQFFYNAGNPGGSPLSVREDVTYDLGIIPTSPTSAFANKPFVKIGDDIYFVAENKKTNRIQLYVLSDYIVTPIGDSFLNDLVTAHNSLWLSSIVSKAGYMLCLSIWSTIDPVYRNYIYDIESKFTYEWQEGASTLSLGSKGRIIYDTYENIENSSIDNKYTMMNGVGDVGHWTHDQTDTYLATTAPVVAEVQTPEFTADTMLYKFQHALDINCDYVTDGQTLDVSFTDDGYFTYSTPRTINLNQREQVKALGRFNKRAFKLEWSGDTRIRKLEIRYDIGYV